MVKRILLPAILLIVLSGTFANTAGAGLKEQVDPSIKDGSAAKRLAEAQADWDRAGIDNYAFRITASCFCPRRDPVLVTVRGGESTLSDPNWFGPKSVPELFEFIAEAIAGNSAQLTVEYREADGVPEVVSVDRRRMIVDEEISYQVTDFTDLDSEPLPPGVATTVAEAKTIARRTLKRGPRSRSWKKGTKRSIHCAAKPDFYDCRAKWTVRQKLKKARIFVPRATA